MTPEELTTVKNKIRAGRFVRLAPLTVHAADDTALKLTFAIPQGPAEQSFGTETFALTSADALHCGNASTTNVLLDNSLENKLGVFSGAVLADDKILVTVKFNSTDAYLTAQAGAVNRLSLKYQITKFTYMEGTAFRVQRIELCKVGLCSDGFTVKQQYRKFKSFFGEPQTQTRPVRFVGMNSNAEVLTSERAVIVEFAASLPCVTAEGDMLRLQPDAFLPGLVGCPVFPCRDNKPVLTASPLGLVDRCHWTTEQRDAPAKGEDAKETIGIGKAVISFANTAAGQKEFEAMKSQEKRGVVVAFKIRRLQRDYELVGGQPVHYVSLWEPQWIGLEDGTVLTEAESEAAAPAPIRAGWLKRMGSAIMAQRQ